AFGNAHLCRQDGDECAWSDYGKQPTTRKCPSPSGSPGSPVEQEPRPAAGRPARSRLPLQSYRKTLWNRTGEMECGTVTLIARAVVGRTASRMRATRLAHNRLSLRSASWHTMRRHAPPDAGHAASVAAPCCSSRPRYHVSAFADRPGSAAVPQMSDSVA